MSGEQISQCSDLILDCYKDIYKVEDFVRCFKNIKLLKYGKFYEGIDGGKIIEMISQYDIEREQEIMEYHKKKSEDFKKQPVIWDEKITEKISEKVKEIGVVKSLEPRKIERTEEQKIFDVYFKEFDKLYDKQGGNKGVFRFVTYKQKKLNVQEYVNLRFKEDNL